MLSRMDRYVGAAVLEAYFATGATFFVISVLFDLLASLGKYARQAHEVLKIDTWGLSQLLCEFYVCSLPVMYLMLAPYVTVIACMFGVTKLTTANELVPMLFSGRSMFRVLRPVVVVAALSGLGMAGVWQWGGTLVSERYHTLRDMLTNDTIGDASKNVLVSGSDPGDPVMRCARYQASERTISGLTVLETLETGFAVVIAKQATWDDTRGLWVLTEGTRTTGNRIVPLRELSLRGVTPDVVLRLSRGAKFEFVQMLSFTELRELRELRPGRQDLVLAYHLHFATPLACLILVLLTLTLAVQFERGSRIGRVIIAFFICVGYLVVDLTCRSLGLQQFINPVVAAWTPAIVFGALGLVSYSGIRT